MMKTNWSSTWPAIYQSPAAEMVLFACEGIQRISVRSISNPPQRSGERRKTRKKKERKRRERFIEFDLLQNKGGTKVLHIFNGLKYCKTRRNTDFRGSTMNDGGASKLSTFEISFSHGRRTTDERWVKQAETWESDDFFFPCKVINKIPDYNSFWQITTQGIRVVWLCRTLPHTQSLITSPPAHALPPTLLQQDIWWKDKLRWRRYIFFFFRSKFISSRRKFSRR